MTGIYNDGFSFASSRDNLLLFFRHWVCQTDELLILQLFEEKCFHQ
jgi:hypothetical protein